MQPRVVLNGAIHHQILAMIEDFEVPEFCCRAQYNCITVHLLTHFSTYMAKKVQFGRTDLLYIFDEAVTDTLYLLFLIANQL